jgi:hypothetical protein
MNTDKTQIEAQSQPSCLGAVSSSAFKLNVANFGWKVLSPENKDKAVAIFHRHDDAVHFAVMKWGKYSEWEVKSCDKRIPLHCY